MLVKEDTSQLARAKIHQLAPANGLSKNPTPGLSGMDKVKVDPASLTQIRMSATQLAQLHRQMDSLQAAMQKAHADSAQSARIRRQADSVQSAIRKLQADTAQLASHLRLLNSVFSFTPALPQDVIIVMDKVDPVYVTETRNAFNRYNLENYYSLSLTIDNSSVNDSLKLVVIGSFPNSDAAMEYLQKAKASAPREIVPWLPVNKYSFQVISGTNLQLLLSNKDMAAYRQFLMAAYPGKF